VRRETRLEQGEGERREGFKAGRRREERKGVEQEGEMEERRR
jgi:hypothetical protein